jgi:hypothetical protein
LCGNFRGEARADRVEEAVESLDFGCLMHGFRIPQR